MLKIMNRDEGFTGLEAAIVLIAFVVVAAVFSYVVLGAGFFTTQKSQEVVYTSVDMASSSMEIIGDVYGMKNTSANNVNISCIRFTLGLAAGGSPVDFDTVQIVYANDDYVEILAKASPNITHGNVLNGTTVGEWNISDGASKDDLLLEGQDMFTLMAAPHQPLDANEEFNLEIRPSVGAAFGLKRTAPAKINEINLLY